MKEHPLYSFNPETKAKKIAAAIWVEKGESLAGERKLEEAVTNFKYAKELDASLTFDPQEKANKLVASALIDMGESLADEEKLKEAVVIFKRAKELDASLIDFFPK